MSTVVEQWLALTDELRGEFPAEIILALIERVSGGNVARIGPGGGRGLMQIDPDTAAGIGVEAADLFDPSINIETGVQLLEQRAGQLLEVSPTLAQRPEDLEPLTVGAYFFGPALVLRELRALPGDASSEDVLERTGLERIELFVGDVMSRATSLQLEIDEGIPRDDEPIGGPGEAPAPPAPEPEPEKSNKGLFIGLGIAAVVVGVAFLALRKNS